MRSRGARSIPLCVSRRSSTSMRSGLQERRNFKAVKQSDATIIWSFAWFVSILPSRKARSGLSSMIRNSFMEGSSSDTPSNPLYYANATHSKEQGQYCVLLSSSQPAWSVTVVLEQLFVAFRAIIPYPVSGYPQIGSAAVTTWSQSCLTLSWCCWIRDS